MRVINTIVIFILYILLLPSTSQAKDPNTLSELTRIGIKKFEALSNAEEGLLEAISKGEKYVAKKAFPTLTLPERDGKAWEEYQKELDYVLEENKIQNEARVHLIQTDPNAFRAKIKDTEIREQLISWLCTDSQAKSLVTNRGISIENADIGGYLDLSLCQIPFPITFNKCNFVELDLSHATLHSIEILDSWCPILKADHITVIGDIVVERTRIFCGIQLWQSAIGGHLSLFESKLKREPGMRTALNCAGIEVGGRVFLDGLVSDGDINFSNAQLQQDFKFRKSSLEGVLVLREAKIEGSLLLGGKFLNKESTTILGEAISVGGIISLKEEFLSEGEVNFNGAKIGMNLECDGATIKNKNGYTLLAPSLKVGENLFLRNGFTSNGTVMIQGSQIDGGVDFTDAHLIDPNGISLDAGYLKIGRSIDFFRTESKGMLDLSCSIINKDIKSDNSLYIDPNNIAFYARDMEVMGNLVFMNEQIDGKILLEGSVIHDFLIWKKLKTPEKAIIDFSHLFVNSFSDTDKSWPCKGNLVLTRFKYKEISTLDDNVNERIKWLNLQDSFDSESYEVLANALEKRGLFEDAKSIRIEKAKIVVKNMKWGWKKLWFRILGIFASYGYEPLNTLTWMLGFIAGSTVFLGICYKADVLKTKESVYSKFWVVSLLWYSIDLFIPIINFLTKPNWSIVLPKKLILKKNQVMFAWLLNIFIPVYVFFGWLLSTIFLLGIADIAKV